VRPAEDDQDEGAAFQGGFHLAVVPRRQLCRVQTWGSWSERPGRSWRTQDGLEKGPPARPFFPRGASIS
jgi:hypothetical protein